MLNEINLPFAALTVEQAGQFIRDIVSRELQSIKIEKPDPPPRSGILYMDEAVTFLCDNGRYVTKKSLYNLVSEKRIPHRKIGIRNVFDRTELLDWIEGSVQKGSSRADAVLLLAKNARNKYKPLNRSKK